MSKTGVYLVFADETEEFPVALRYAARLAQTNSRHVGILHIVNVDDFQHWGNVEERMRMEMRERAEKLLWSVAENVNVFNGTIPSLYLEEGNNIDVLVDVINRNTNIEMLVLAGVSGNAGPGPMVSHFSGKGLAKLRVPIVIVPSHLDPEKIGSIL